MGGKQPGYYRKKRAKKREPRPLLDKNIRRGREKKGENEALGE